MGKKRGKKLAVPTSPRQFILGLRRRRGPIAKFPNFPAPAGSKSNSKATNEVAGPQMEMWILRNSVSGTKPCLKTILNAGFKFITGLASPSFSPALISPC